MDVSDLLAEIQAENEPMFDSLIKVVTFEDKQWAVPYYPSATVLFYRKDMLEQAGLSGPPETWDQFKEYAAALTNPAEGVYGAGVRPWPQLF